jgi:hypothetical protein
MKHHTKFSHLFTGLLPILLCVVAVGGILLTAQPASAQTCIQEVWQAHGNNQRLTCTAQDVTLSSATNINILTGGFCDPVTGECKCFAGGTVTFTADFQMDLTADTRFDVGFYIATDGDPNNDGAITGQCTATASLTTNTPARNFINLDAQSQPGDVCGDITGPFNTAHNPLFVTTRISTQCPLTGENLPLDFATTWRQPGSNQVCDGTGTSPATNDVFPGSPSKCNVGTLVLPIEPVPVDVTLAKDYFGPPVPETGGDATYTVTITNPTALPITLTQLTDDKYGDITTVHGVPDQPFSVEATTCVPDGNPATCEVGGVIAAGGGSCSCTFTGVVPPGDFVPGVDCSTLPTPLAGCFPDTVEACATNQSFPTPPGVCKTDPAVVPYLDVPQAPSLTKTASAQCQIDVTYTVVVTNNVGQDPSPGALTLNTLLDDQYGNITVVQGNIISTTCAVPQTIQPNSNYTCSFVGRINSCITTLTDVVTGGAVDDDGQVYPTPDVPFTDPATVIVNVTTPPQ